MIKLFNIEIPSTAHSVVITATELRETCTGALIWKKKIKDPDGVSMHEALPDVNKMWVVDWKVHANTVVPEIYTWIKQFLANDIQTKYLHLCNESVIEKPVWSSKFYETILDVINGPVEGDVILEFLYRSRERECPEYIKKEFTALVGNINIKNYSKITFGYQHYPNDMVEIDAYII